MLVFAMTENLFATQKILPVGQFAKLISANLADLGEFIVEGEISQMQISQGKWLFLTLKDETAAVSVFAPVFRITSASLLSEGMKVQVYGKAGLYEKTGRFSLNAYRIVPAGEGALRLAYERLKAKLAAEGLFDSARKRPLPALPTRIGLITAKGARAYSDFVKVLGERLGGLTIEFYPVQVQGKESVASVLSAFAYFNGLPNPPDVIVLTRGGGSLEDLLSFNDEQVARAVFSSKVPVVSAIGHEEDVALTDFVADLRASTPSNAAELLVPSRLELASRLQNLELQLTHSITHRLADCQVLVAEYVNSLSNCLTPRIRRVEVLYRRLNQQVGIVNERLHRLHNQGSYQLSRLQLATSGQIRSHQTRLQSLVRLLNSLDYHKVLARGYSITTSGGRVVRDLAKVAAGETLATQLATGLINSTVVTIEPIKPSITKERLA